MKALWLGAGDVPPGLEAPCVWLLADGDPAVEAMAGAVSPTRADLADAALFTTLERSAGRLRRRMLLRALAARCLDCPPQALDIVRSPQGAPSIVGPRALCVSLSARPGWTMIGLGRRPLGVDIEPLIETPLPLDILHPDEAAALAQLDEPERQAWFTGIWTVKEAALKALGQGLVVDPAGLRIRFGADQAEVLRDVRLIATAETRSLGDATAAVATL